MTKPLAEWLKYRFGMELGYVVQMLQRGNLKINVNGISIKNMSYALKQGDTVTIGSKDYEVKWKDKNADERSTDK